jgi:hypothetical protein
MYQSYSQTNIIYWINSSRKGILHRNSHAERLEVTNRGSDVENVDIIKGRYYQRSILSKVDIIKGQYYQRSILSNVDIIKGRYYQRGGGVEQSEVTKGLIRRRIEGWGVSHHFQQYFSCIVVVSFIGGGNRCGHRKPPTCRKSQTNCIT